MAPVYGLFARSMQAEYRRVAALLQERRLLVPETTVLDVGTGTGALAGILAEVTPQVTGIDPSAKMLAAGRRKYGGRVAFHQAAAHELECCPPGRFDLVTAALVLHGPAAPYRRKVLGEMRRVARKKVVVVDYAPHRSLGVAAIEALEGSHYREFMRQFAGELDAVFPRVEMLRLTRIWGLYLCDP